MLKGVNGDRPLADLCVPVTGNPLHLFIAAIAGLAIEIDGVASTLLRLTFVEWVNFIIEMAPSNNPAIRVVSQRRPLR